MLSSYNDFNVTILPVDNQTTSGNSSNETNPTTPTDNSTLTA
jgi:hypothetical protein